MVGFIYFNKSQPKHNIKENKNIIIKRLGFDRNQILLYDSLIQWHRSELTKIENEIIIKKTKLYHLLRSGQNTSNKDSIILDITSAQSAIENVHFKHFDDLKKLCNSDQISKFDSLLTEVAQMFARKPPNHPKK